MFNDLCIKVFEIDNALFTYLPCTKMDLMIALGQLTCPERTSWLIDAMCEWCLFIMLWKPSSSEVTIYSMVEMFLTIAVSLTTACRLALSTVRYLVSDVRGSVE